MGSRRIGVVGGLIWLKGSMFLTFLYLLGVFWAFVYEEARRLVLSSVDRLLLGKVQVEVVFKVLIQLVYVVGVGL